MIEVICDYKLSRQQLGNEQRVQRKLHIIGDSALLLTPSPAPRARKSPTPGSADWGLARVTCLDMGTSAFLITSFTVIM